MDSHASTLTSLSDAALLTEVTRLAAQERGATTDLIAALIELDTRQLYVSTA